MYNMSGKPVLLVGNKGEIFVSLQVLVCSALCLKRRISDYKQSFITAVFLLKVSNLPQTSLYNEKVAVEVIANLTISNRNLIISQHYSEFDYICYKHSGITATFTTFNRNIINLLR